jgi:hypothetical protein
MDIEREILNCLDRIDYHEACIQKHAQEVTRLWNKIELLNSNTKIKIPYER